MLCMPWLDYICLVPQVTDQRLGRADPHRARARDGQRMRGRRTAASSRSQLRSDGSAGPPANVGVVGPDSGRRPAPRRRATPAAAAAADPDAAPHRPLLGDRPRPDRARPRRPGSDPQGARRLRMPYLPPGKTNSTLAEQRPTTAQTPPAGKRCPARDQFTIQRGTVRCRYYLPAQARTPVSRWPMWHKGRVGGPGCDLAATVAPGGSPSARATASVQSADREFLAAAGTSAAPSRPPIGDQAARAAWRDDRRRTAHKPTPQARSGVLMCHPIRCPSGAIGIRTMRHAAQQPYGLVARSGTGSPAPALGEQSAGQHIHHGGGGLLGTDYPEAGRR